MTDNNIMSRDEVRAFDAWAINELGIAGTVLMENAGRGCAEHIIKEMDSRLRGNDKCEKRAVVIFCGTGNNGGDGYVIARHLHNKGFSVKVIICGDINKVKGDAKANLDLWIGMKQQVSQLDLAGDIAGQISEFCSEAALIVDAIFGTGLSGTVRDDYIQLIEAVNASGIEIVAVDIPSGLDCDTGLPLGGAIRAKSTVTFVAMKKGFAENEQSLEYTGKIEVCSIGIEPSAKSP
jgi:NAD(P)H-hydrate epimerase